METETPGHASQDGTRSGQTTPEICPHCRRSVDWGRTSWCPDCGYYAPFQHVVACEPVPDSFSSSHFEFSWSWFSGTIVGAILILVSSLALRFLLPDSLDRAELGRSQFALGVLLLVLAQIRAYSIAAFQSSTIQLSALVAEPVLLWKAVVQQLPMSRGTLNTAAWGMTCLVMAVSVIGMDLDSLFGNGTARKKVSVMQALVKAISSAAGAPSAFSDDGSGGESEGGSFLGGVGGAAPSGGSGNIEQAMESFAGSAGIDSAGGGGSSLASVAAGAGGLTDAVMEQANGSFMPKQAVDPEQAKRELLDSVPESPLGEKRTDLGRFAVAGYTTNSGGQLASLILAEIGPGSTHYLGKMSLEETGPDERKQLQARLDRVRTPHPAIKVPFNARWVRPVVTAQIAFAGKDRLGHLRAGYLISYEEPDMASANGDSDQAVTVRH